jgi:hypothetical protein
VEVIRFNLLLADWGDEDHFESLLAEKNSKWGREYLSNVKCVVTCADVKSSQCSLRDNTPCEAARISAASSAP